MIRLRSNWWRMCSGVAVAVWLTVTALGAALDPPPSPAQESFRFKTGVDLVNVTVTVTDRHGRFVPNLTRDDFVVYEDNRAQPITHFVNERVPVSLGLAIDASGSMAGDKMIAAREALRRFVDDLLGPDDEVFVYRFNETPELVQGWTRDRRIVHDRIGSIRPNGGTALYDTVVDAVSLAQSGQHRKKALVIISDGNDLNSSATVDDVQRRIRETEVLVYAVGIDGEDDGARTFSPPRPSGPPGRPPFPLPFPGTGRRYPRPTPPVPQPLPWPTGGRGTSRDDRVNEVALRAMTDDSGGRTELIRTAIDLDPATAAIANELSRQYFIGYPAAATRDGRWHGIRVDVRNQTYRVRARRGYIF